MGNGLVVTLLEVKHYAEYEVKTFSLGEVSHGNAVSCQFMGVRFARPSLIGGVKNGKMHACMVLLEFEGCTCAVADDECVSSILAKHWQY